MRDKITMFNASAFLLSMTQQLRQLGVDLSPANAPTKSIERMECTEECYKVELWGHTAEDRPAYWFVCHVYPDKKTLFVNHNHSQGEFFGGYTPIERKIIEHGLLGYEQDEWKVEFE